MAKRETIKFYKPEQGPNVWLPLYMSGVQAGFPSPADDYIEGEISLDAEFIRDSACTFFAHSAGDSMIEDAILPGDLLTVDKSLEPIDGDVAVCYVNGDFTVKRLKFGKDGSVTLMPANRKYQPIVVAEGEQLIVWGVVTSLHRHLRRNVKRKR